MARLVHVDGPTVSAVLSEEVDAGTVVHHRGRLSGWTLTAHGRIEGERLLAVEMDRSGARGAIAASYEDFLVLNTEFLDICSAWQIVIVDGQEVVNDHGDVTHDRGVLDRLDVVHERALRLTDKLGASSPRFSGYAERLTAAQARVASGETEWLTRPTIDSYHSVWFELHENLLASLGRRRSQERQR